MSPRPRTIHRLLNVAVSAKKQSHILWVGRMISTSKKFLFIHIPKTGGNSIQTLLSQYSEDEIDASSAGQDGIERFGVINRTYNTRKHSPLSEYKRVIDTDTYGSLFKFATIRNPWDRMISFYFSPHSGVEEFDRVSFLTLIKRQAPVRRFVREARPLPLRIMSKLRLIAEGDSKAIDTDVDVLLRFEHLDDDFRAVCEQLDIPAHPLPIRNRSVRSHYSEYYDDESDAIIRARFADEIAYGGYRFEAS